MHHVARGANEWSLDQGLKWQAEEAGVHFEWNSRLTKVPDGKVIILQNRYNLNGFRKWVLLPFAKLWYSLRLNDKRCIHENCTCVWCIHGNHKYKEILTDC